MVARSLLFFILIAQLGAASYGEEVSSKEYGFSVTTPESVDWKVLQNGASGQGKNRSYFLVLVNSREQKNLSYMSLPMGPDATGKKAAKTLDDVKDGFEKGFLKKADEKVSSADIELAGQKAYRMVALKKLPSGEERHLVNIIFVANGRTNSIAGMTKVPWDKDEILARFLDSLKIDER